MRKRVLSAFLSVVLLLSCADYTVFAAEVVESVQETEQESVIAETDEVEEEPEDTQEENTEMNETEENLTESSDVEEATIVNDRDEVTYELTYTIEQIENIYDPNYDDYGGEKYAVINGYTGTASGELIIPSEIDGYPVKEIRGFKNCTEFTGKLVIPSSVIKIGDHAFEGCTGLTELEISSGVKWINSGAFYECTGFVGKLIIPSSVEEMESFAFFGCTGFTELEILSSMSSIEDSVFGYCTGFTGNLVIPSNITSIGNSAFFGCTGFTGELVITSNIDSIGNSAFSGCTGFTGELVIPSNITSIGDRAFSGCTGFTGELVIPSNMTSIPDGLFSGCTGFTGELIIPSNVTTIGEGAFKGCIGFNGKLVIPSSVSTIGQISSSYPNGAFEDCTGFNGLEISSGVDSIGDYTFSGCTGFEGELIIPSSISDIGHSAFYGCTGLTGKLVIPSSVDKVGTAAFFGCDGLTALEISLGVRSIGDVAFGNCSGFIGELVIPTSVVDIGDSAFVNCRGFVGNLKIPDGTVNINAEAFFGCYGLEHIYLPQSVSYIGEGAFHAWKMPDYSSYENLDVTMHCYTDSYAYNWSVENGFNVEGIESASTTPITIDPEKYIIYIYDTEAETPIANAAITISDQVFQTNSDGLVSFSAADVAIKTKIQVSADGYPVVETVRSIKNGTVTRIGMQPVTDKLTITSVSGELGEESYDFLSEKLVLGYYADLTQIESPEQQTLKITVKANKSAANYEIITEDGTIVMSNTTGVFDITTVTSGVLSNQNTIKPSMPINSTLENGKVYYVKVTDSEGNTAKKKIKLSATVNYITAEREYQKGEFELGKAMKVEIPNDIPLIGGSTYKVGFEKALPVEMSVDEFGKVKIALNKPVDMPLNKYHEIYKGLEKRALRASMAKALGKSVAPFGAGFIDADGKVCGYGEGNISELDEGKITIDVGIMAEIEGQGGYKYYFFIGTVPVNVFIEGSVKSTFKTEGEVKIENWKLKSFDITGGSINIKVEVTVGGGVGVGLELNASGTGSLNYLWKPARDYQKAWLEGSLKVVGCVGPFEKTLWKTDKYKYTILEEGKDTSTNILGLSANSLGITTATDSSFEPMSRNYLNYAEGYNTNFKTQSISSNETATGKTVLKEAVYPSASPKMVEVNGAKYLFWLEDITSRNLNNRTALVYSKSPNEITWSEPVQLIKEMEDGTLDNAYDVYVENDKIYVTWQDATRVITEEDDVLSAMNALSVRLVQFDTQTDTVTENKCLTKDAGYYMYPCTVAAGGESYTAYVHNMLDSGDVLGNNTQHLYCIKGTENEAKEIALPEKAQIVNMDGGIFEGEASVVCELDLDGDITTDTDREIYAYSMQSEKSYRLSDNSVVDTMPILADSGKIYWYQDANLMQVSDGKNAAVPVWEESVMLNPAVFVVVTDDNGKDTILWEAGDIEAEDGSIAVYQTCEQEDGSFGNVVKCVETDGTVAYRIAAAGSGAELQIAYLEGVFLEDGSLLKDLCVATRQNVNDIMVEYVTYNEEEAGAGAALPLQAAITNIGNTTVNEITVSVNEQIMATLQDVNLLPGESKEITVSGFSVPSEMTSSQSFTLQAVAKNEQNVEDNQAEFLLGCSDVYMETDIRLAEEETWLDINLWNSNEYVANGNLKVHKGTLDGDIIYEKSFENISTENGCAYTVNLGAYEDKNVKYYVELVTDNEENNEGNNTEFVYIGYGTGVEDSTEGEEATAEITALSLNEQKLELVIGESAQLEVSANISSEWNKEELLWVSGDRRVASVDNNGQIKAYREGTTEITVYYGDISAVCEVTVTGEKSETLSVKFDTQGGNTIEPITGITPGSIITLPENVTRQGYMFKGWYTQPRDGEKISGTTITVEKSMTLYAQWMGEWSGNDLWIQSIPDQTYTGKAIKPKVVVYDGETLLKEKKDYTVSYKNNIKVNDATVLKTAPTVVITGKGNYSGKETATFCIVPKAITSSDIQVADLFVNYNKRVQNPVPVVTMNGKKLKNKTDFTLEYPDTSAGAYKEPGTYEIVIKGTGGYTGERSIQLMITNNILMSKASVSKIKNQTYTGKEITPQLTVKYKGKLLTEGTDYKVSYENNKEIGTAAAVVTGIGGYSGEKRINFKIMGTSIAKAKVEGLENTAIYTGAEIEQSCSLTVNMNGTIRKLSAGTDYTVSYQNNKNAGTATVIFTGTGGYSGTLKKKFKIKAYNIKDDTENALKIEKDIVAAYAKGGSKPKPVVTFKGTVLTEGVDYKLRYKNNKAVTNGSDLNKQPIMTITGKGNFKGVRTEVYRIETQDIGLLNMTVADKTYQKKANAYKSVPKIVDLDGKVLTAGKDYEKKVEYTYAEKTKLYNGVIRNAGESIGTEDILPAGTIVQVTVEGIGNYTGTIIGQYRIVQTDIKKASVKVEAQTYTGSAIEPDKTQITIKMGKVTLADTDYEIVSYSDNVKKGTAKVVLKGGGNYGGTKTVKFKIKSKGFIWWFRSLFSN